MADLSPSDQPVLLVSEHGAPLGAAGKLEVHQPPGMLHLAYSVALFDEEGRILLQRRSEAKHHFRGKWSNACCSHPRPGANIVEEARRRVHYELGVSCLLREVGSFVYRSTDSDTGLVEHEFDTVLIGNIESSVEFNLSPSEASDVRFVDAEWLGTDIRTDCNVYTPWLQHVLRVAGAARQKLPEPPP